MGKVLSKLKWFLPVIIVLLLQVAGAGILTALIAGFACTILLWWLGRAVKPEGELPNASVSCCHFLGEDADD